MAPGGFSLKLFKPKRRYVRKSVILENSVQATCPCELGHTHSDGP